MSAVHPIATRSLQTSVFLVSFNGLYACRHDSSRDSLDARIETPTEWQPRSAFREPSTPSDHGTFVDRQMALRVAQFGSSMIAVAPIERGVLGEGSAASHEYDVIASHCYRVMAVGGIELRELTLALFSPDGTLLTESADGGDYPSLGDTRPFCPASSGHYRVEIRARAGQGDYGIMVLRTP